VILDRAEVRVLLAGLAGTPRLVGVLLYGTGMRVVECLQLRVQDVDFLRNEVTVRDGKGDKDRVAPLPVTVKPDLAAHLDGVRVRHAAGLGRGLGRAPLPDALARK